MNLRVALPKGRLLAPTAALLDKAGWGLEDYSEKARLYRLKSHIYPELTAKMFQEKDIPIQVAIGNYDMGVCGLDWLAEYTARFPSTELCLLRELGYGEGAVYAAAPPGLIADGVITTSGENVRIASEYPNLAESLALALRLRRFSIYPVWGAADAYPPENAEIVLLSRRSEAEIASAGLVSLGMLKTARACLIVNRKSLSKKDLSPLLDSLKGTAAAGDSSADIFNLTALAQRKRTLSEGDASVVRLALPDGHQQAHVRKILDAAGVMIEEYPSTTGVRRPKSSLEGFAITVIRPQDMPLQVAAGNFDLAITGRDWLTDHHYQFPGSPVKELLDLKYGRVRIVAVVANEVLADTTAELSDLRQREGGACRIAAEYVNIADYYARTNRLGAYRIVPTWGATEAYIPEDADVLVENTETGSTIARHNLKIIETLFESTACIIGSTRESQSAVKTTRIDAFVELMRRTMDVMG
ncbi:MAG: ATP phosphoribosyltransferase [Dehalococcoidia bacterium]|nr:ATP phosphoribosyltransferase [Dehalococcoidia bacterium]